MPVFKDVAGYLWIVQSIPGLHVFRARADLAYRITTAAYRAGFGFAAVAQPGFGQDVLVADRAFYIDTTFTRF